MTKQCLQCQREFKTNKDLSKKDQENSRFCSRPCYWVYRKEQKMWPPSQAGKIPWNKGKKYLAIAGEKHHNWKGGVTPLHRQIRASLEYQQWRVTVFKRDDYTCQTCGIRGGYLQADHIKPFAYFPELRFDPKNGRTLCVNCHRMTPSYGRQKQGVVVCL